MEFLAKYRGAALFKDLDDLNIPDEEVLTKKIRSEGRHPKNRNLKVEFSADAENWEEAKNKVIQQIDHYLEEHDLREFNFDALDLTNR